MPYDIKFSLHLRRRFLHRDVWEPRQHRRSEKLSIMRLFVASIFSKEIVMVAEIK